MYAYESAGPVEARSRSQRTVSKSELHELSFSSVAQ